MHKRARGGGLITAVLLPMGLICIFAFCSLLLVVVGVDVYRQVQDSGDRSYDSAVLASYLRTKVVQNNVEGCIYLRDEDGLEVLVIESAAQGTELETLIFFQDGKLYEGLKLAEDDFNPGLASAIASVDGCSFAITDGLLTAELLIPGGEVARVAVTLAGEVRDA